MRIFMLMLDIMRDKHRHFQRLISFRRTEEVEGQEEYGDDAFHGAKVG